MSVLRCVFSIDATKSDGMGRLVNDSVTQRKANATVKEVIHGGISHLCIFVTGCQINVGEEILYYYGPTDEHMHWRKVLYLTYNMNCVIHLLFMCLLYCFISH